MADLAYVMAIVGVFACCAAVLRGVRSKTLGANPSGFASQDPEEIR